MAEVCVLGTLAADVMVRVPTLPRPGEHVQGEDLGWRVGGSSANVAWGLVGGGHRVELIGPVGDDDLSIRMLAELAARGIRTDRCVRVAAPAPRALILLDESGERTIIVLGRGSAIEGYPIIDLPDLAHVDCVYVESFVRFPGTRAGFGPDTLVVATAPTLVKHGGPADLVIGSEMQYPGGWQSSPYEAARAVAGPRLRWVIVTHGARGADAYGPDRSCHVPGRRARQIDATGAGDAFAAGLIGGLLDGLGIEEAMEIGSRQGAAAVEVLQSVPPDPPRPGA